MIVPFNSELVLEPSLKTALGFKRFFLWSASASREYATARFDRDRDVRERWIKNDKKNDRVLFLALSSMKVNNNQKHKKIGHGALIGSAYSVWERNSWARQ